MSLTQPPAAINEQMPPSAGEAPEVPNPPEHPVPDGEPYEEPDVDLPEQQELPFEIAVVIQVWLPKSSLTEHPLIKDGSVTESVVTKHILSRVRDWTEMAAPQTTQKAREMLRSSLGLGIWAWHTLGTLDEGVVWHPDNVELWSALVMEHHKTRGWRHQARTVLRTMGRAVNPEGWPPESHSIGTPEVAPPYDADEEEMFRAFASLPGRANLAARQWLVTSTCGAGLTGAEAARSVPEDVVELPGGRLAIDVRGPAPRRVPIREAYTFLARNSLRAAGGRKFIPGGNQIAVNIAGHMLADRRVYPDAKPLSLRRARNTWLVAHLRANTPLPVLRRLAGRLSHRTLEALYQHASNDVPEEEAITLGLGA